MLRTSPTPNLVSVLLVPLALAAVAARADVVIEETMNTDGVAGFSMLAMQGTTTRSLSADKQRTDSNLQFKSKLLNTFAGRSGPTSQIVRLDKGLMWEVQSKDKTYTERTFADARAAMEKALQQMEAASQQAQAQQPQQELPINAAESQCSPAVVEARVTGEQATIAGLQTSRQVVSLKQTCTDPKTMKACDMVWSIEEWSTAQAPGMDESKAFALNYAKQMGLDASSMQAMQSRMQNAFSQYKGTWTELMTKASTFQGYPLKTALQMSMGGPQCTTDDGTQVASAPGFADAVQAGVDAGVSTAAGEVASAATQAAIGKAGGGAAGAVAGSAVGGFASKFGSSMMSKLHKKDAAQPKAEAAAAPTGADAGMIRLFRMQTETTAIRGDAIPASTFEVPAGFKKVAAK
jgi:hypothetical protein